MMMINDAANEAPSSELPLFACKGQCYVYQIPPATTVGHRAETWNVNKWLSEVSVRVVAADEQCSVRLEDLETGALYAECPIPSDKPIITVVEPVIDSSRYFVLRIEDRASRRHAFIGLGFRERAHASDFNAALHEHQQYVRRKRLAEAQRAAFEERERLAGEDGSDAGVAASPAALAPAVDRSLKPGECLTLRIAAGASRGGFVSSRQGSLGKKQVSLVMDGEAVLAPPPPAGRRRSTDLPMCVSPSTSSASEASDSADSAEEGGEAVCSRLRALQLGDSPRTGGDAGATTKQRQQARSQAQQPQQAGGGPQPAAGDQGGAGVPPAEDDSEFGEFVG